jgi:cysteine desulfurase
MTDSAPAFRRVYLDHQATTPVAPEVLDAMLPHYGAAFGNASSRQHGWGLDAAAAVEHARRTILTALGSTDADDRLVFTSGATEAVNLALMGAIRASRHERPHVVTVATEHHAVLDVLEGCAGSIALTVLPVDAQGHLDLAQLASAIGSDTVLVSVMHANNEIGTVHDIAAIGRLCRERDVLFHTDATQTLGRLPLDVTVMHVDLLCASAHKLYGPKGAGALFVGARARRHGLVPLLRGGGQEGGLRAGTLNVPGIVGFGAAVRLAMSRRDDDRAHLDALLQHLHARLAAGLPQYAVNGAWPMRLPGNLNLRVDGVRADLLLSALRGIALSTGSACSSGAPGASHVLRAIGLTAEQAACSVRIGAGRHTTAEEIDYFCNRFFAVVSDIRARQGH